MLTDLWMSYSASFLGKDWELVVHFFGLCQLKYGGLAFKMFPLSKIAEVFALYKASGAIKGRILVNFEA
ncbi:hypothetical protein [Olsenella sp. HMSC062G07]|uniref:hypothetical protein n=1 Tax=Olsenella sp. HMSC062G07 TaxID=1739330 RepID=UPI0008A454E9|nr:hypothetical protein [Olsenella sp. HMSC062G07]OFK23411.1 hypothetical protein HMPREF2826_04835 [Olsenella sp. HMSC062G07]